jgi:hypothetical protein
MARVRRKPRPGQKGLGIELTKEGKIPISKLDAARRQLETAVDLWFHEGDPVSIHTLVMAAHEILRVLNGAANGPPMMGEPCPHIREEYTDEWRELCLASSKFFKHSARDAQETHYFSPRLNDAFILDATETYHRLTDNFCPLFRLFRWYMQIHVPRIFRGMLPPVAPDLSPMTKTEFFTALIEIASDPEPIAEQAARLQQILSLERRRFAQ